MSDTPTFDNLVLSDRIAELEQQIAALREQLARERKWMHETRERFDNALDAMRQVWA